MKKLLLVVLIMMFLVPNAYALSRTSANEQAIANNTNRIDEDDRYQLRGEVELKVLPTSDLREKVDLRIGHSMNNLDITNTTQHYSYVKVILDPWKLVGKE